MSRAFFLCMKGAGFVFSIAAMAPSASALRFFASFGTMSSSTTGTPALATWAAIAAPMTPAPMTATFSMVISAGLQNRRDTLSAADALRRKAERLAFALQQARDLAGDPCAGCAERMAKRDGAAIEIGFREINARLMNNGERLGGEGFVQLDDINILDGEAGALQRFLGRRDGADPHDLRRTARDCDGANAREFLEAMRIGIVFRADKRCRRAVGKRGRGRRRHRARFIEGGLQAGQRLKRRLGADAAILLDARIAINDGDNLIGEFSARARGRRPRMALDRQFFLLLAGDLVFLREIFRRDPHRNIGFMVVLDRKSTRLNSSHVKI